MSERKMASSRAAEVMDEGVEHSDLPSEKAGTSNDRQDMRRMGLQQELKVSLVAQTRG
jgi:hypothetical protein